MPEDASPEQTAIVRAYFVVTQLVLVVVAALTAHYVDATASALTQQFKEYRIDDNLLSWVVTAIAWHRITWLGPIVLIGIAMWSLVAAKRRPRNSVAFCLVLSVAVFVVTMVWSHLIVWAMYSQFYWWGTVV